MTSRDTAIRYCQLFNSIECNWLQTPVKCQSLQGSRTPRARLARRDLKVTGFQHSGASPPALHKNWYSIHWSLVPLGDCRASVCTWNPMWHSHPFQTLTKRKRFKSKAKGMPTSCKHAEALSAPGMTSTLTSCKLPQFNSWGT